MDFEGFGILIERDYEEFSRWEKNAKKMSLEELRENYNIWHQKMVDVKEKYGFSKEQENKDDVSTFMAKLTYFYYNAMFCWKSLNAYTEKLREKHEKLKKPNKLKKLKPKNTKTSKKRTKTS